jgi:hypothetical protein
MTSLAEAVASVERQVLQRGEDGVLRDLAVFLIEDGCSAVLWAKLDRRSRSAARQFHAAAFALDFLLTTLDLRFLAIVPSLRC